MDTLYPYYRSLFHLSIFVLFLLAIVWFSFFWYIFYHQKKRKKISFYPFILALFNISLIFFLQYRNFEEIRYWYPLSVSIILLGYFFLLAYRLPFFIPFRLPFAAGIILGLIPNPFLQIPSNIFFLGTIIAFISIPYLRESPHFAPSGKNKMLPLRKNLDILRFSLLILSLYGIFDEYRHYFPVLISLYTFGFLLQYILYKFHKKRFHIRFGIISLGAFFLFFGILFHFFSLHFTSALMYVFLANWETLYFKKSVESYIEKEQLYFGFILGLGFLLYWMQYRWLFLPVSLLILIVQIFVLRYVYKKYRRTIMLLFLSSFIIWIGNVWYSVINASVETFWIDQKQKINREFLPDPVALFALPQKASITTNLFPEEVIESFNKRQNYFQFVKCSQSYSFLIPTRYLLINKFNQERNHYYLCHIPESSFYSGTKGRSYLFRFIQKYKIPNIFFYDSQVHSIYHPLYSSFKPWQYDRKSILKKAIIPALILAHEQAKWHEKKNNFKAALIQYKKILKFFEFIKEKEEAIQKKEKYSYLTHYKKSSEEINFLNELKNTQINEEIIYKKLANFAAMSPPNIHEQILYLSNYINFHKNNFGKKIKEKTLLMELYLMDNQKKKSYECALKLVQEDPQNAHSYYKHILKLILIEDQKMIRYQKLLKLEYRVKYYLHSKEENARLRMYKDDLLREIKDAIAANQPINPFSSIKESNSVKKHNVY